MKRHIVVSVIMALMLLAWGFFAPAHTQDPEDEEKPTFYRLIPGVYVNGYPRFTVRYPKDWVETRAAVGQVFGAKPSGSGPWEEGLGIWSLGNPPPLDKYVDLMVQYFRAIATDVTVVSDKPSRLRDGTPAREIECRMVRNGVPRNQFCVATNKEGVLISVFVATHKGTIGEDLKAIPYSLQFEPGKDEPVEVPPDVQSFLDKHKNDILSHDVAKVMANYSDKYLNSGQRKGEVERDWRQSIGSIMSTKGAITDFVPAGNRAYFTGLVIINNLFKASNTHTSIIKENGEWKFYGNQRDVVP
jgi:hypothetical protein